MAALALADIQGNVLHGYGFPRAAYLFFEVSDAGSGRAFVRELAITPATKWAKRPPTTTNVALTCAGLRALGVADAVLDRLPEAFTTAIRDRARTRLGDTGPSDPNTWVEGLGTSRSHILVTIGGSSETDPVPFETEIGRLLERAEAHGLGVVHRQEAKALEHRREHFGWADGFGQPAVEGAGDSRAGQGVPQEDQTTWRDVKAGEFILGETDEDDGRVDDRLLRNGTYMVYRKLYQDVARFRRELYAEGLRYGENVQPDPPLDGDQLYELIAAKVVGRWRDGVAIELVQRREESESRRLGGHAQEFPDNDFRYWEDDRDGLRCPRGAHIRRTNPRDALGWNGEMSKSHRIIRRGMPYGTPLPAGVYDDDEEDRGLIFICLNADIARQFEVIQALWCNDGNAFGLSHDKDYLLGDNGGAGRMTIQGDPPHFARTQPDVVLTRGCEYLLVPGIAALRDLAAG